jgi:serine/threonine protein phosphatase PrpC
LKMSSWTIAAASVQGTSHGASNLPCQDAHATFAQHGDDGEPPLLVLVVADGAGSAVHSDIGAQITVDSFINHVRDSLLAPQYGLQREGILRWLTVQLAGHIDVAAAEHRASPREFACTLTAVVCLQGATVVVHVGDSLAVGRESIDQQFSALSYLQNGEYANSTRFVTDPDVSDHLYVEYLEYELAQVAVMSDGVHRFVYDPATQVVNTPFLDQLLRTMCGPVAPSPAALNVALDRFLRSPKVQQRSDDDLTLVLAIRRPARSSEG